MAYITREDGERFVIPSYRDVLSAKKPALLKKEVLLLSSNYGGYISLQRKNINQYEVAFSSEPGYLLGETVWNYFKRPKDLIYCEAIPNTTEAILVIVKGGSVYLDGSFPIDSIPDELVVFRTQQNSFEIYIYGDIPLSPTPEAGKFSLDSSSVKSFNILPGAIFSTLPTIKAFQLRLVDVALKAQGIGVVPIKKIIVSLGIIALIWAGVMYLSTTKQELPTAIVGVVNPYQLYINILRSPSPADEIQNASLQIARLYTIPGWLPYSVDYSLGILRAKLKSSGEKINILYQWAATNNAKLQIESDGIYVSLPVTAISRVNVATISPLQQVIAEVLDRISTVLPGNNMRLGVSIDRGRFFETQLTISFSNLTLEMLNLLADQFKDLPLILVKLTLSVDNGTLSGIVVLKALGN
ncbi:MAG TPA: hypothetical protein VLI69_08560 [Gammaproteobacteria bacterium]|nr:hypothetical protein [Gammaproteobacteria bacterium]